MDRRNAKTENAIISAFCSLIQTKNYADISIQDIIDQADVARATFYDHYKNKEAVLISISSSIFEHITAHSLMAEKRHDFSKTPDFTHRIVHMLYHLREDKQMIGAILSSESHDIFLSDLRKHLDLLIADNLSGEPKISVPKEIYINFVVTTLTELILWWIKENDCSIPPETLAEYYFSLAQFEK